MALTAFAYWDGRGHDVLVDFLAEWRAHFRSFSVKTYPEVEPLVAGLFPEYLSLYRQIRIPAARADLARLVALYESGGLYVDCHCGVGDIGEIRRLLAEGLTAHELILLDKHRGSSPRDVEDIFPLNGVQFARPHSAITLAIARRAFENMAAHQRVERESGFVPYDIWALSGTGVLFDVLFEPHLPGTRLRANYRDRVAFIPQQRSPVICYRHVSYRQPGAHWSERQSREPLFDLD